MTQLTLGIAASALLDVDIREESSELRAAFHDITEEFRKRTARPISLPQWVPTPRNRRYEQALERVNEIIYNIIEQRRAEPGNGVVSTLFEASSESDAELTDKQLRDEVVTLLFAGHETTAIALTFTWYLLATHPKQEEMVVAELDEELGGQSPTMADVPQLAYTRKVLKESLRLYPPVFGVLREPVRDDQIGGYQIPAGATVAMNQIAVHHDREFFDDPKAFTPERWTDSFEESLPQFAYFPFSGGPRRCIGERFAMLEATLVVAMIAQNYHLELLSDSNLTLKPSVTTRPDKPIRVRPQAR